MESNLQHAKNKRLMELALYPLNHQCMVIKVFNLILNQVNFCKSNKKTFGHTDRCSADMFRDIYFMTFVSVSCFSTHIYWHLLFVLKLLWQLFFVTCFMTIVTTTLATIHGQAGETESENKKWVHVILVNNGSEELWSKIYEVGPNIGVFTKITFFSNFGQK